MAKHFRPLENGIEIKADRHGIEGKFRIRGWRWWTALVALVSGLSAMAWEIGNVLKEWFK